MTGQLTLANFEFDKQCLAFLNLLLILSNPAYLVLDKQRLAFLNTPCKIAGLVLIVVTTNHLHISPSSVLTN